MKATIRIVGEDLLCQAEGSTIPEVRLADGPLLPALKDWAQRYESAQRSSDEGAFHGLGREMFQRLDASGWASAWTKQSGTRQLDITVDDWSTPLALALLDAPWELLASPDGFLVDDAIQPFQITRRIGAAREPIQPRHGNLGVVFMAAAPEGQRVLDFEAEESAILEATRGLPLDLVVEESGSAEVLGERIGLDGPFEALHLSCHGDIDRTRGPVLALEDEGGRPAPAAPGDIVGLLGDPEQTPLVFLSACRTAEQSPASGNGSARPDHFVRDLARAGVPNVLGWDGSVFDVDARHFAEVFYGELAKGRDIPRAASMARTTLRERQRADPAQGRHWHLARLYLAPRGGGALVGRDKPRRRYANDANERQFLDKERRVPVASRAEFVGRRRTLQAAIRALRAAGVGVLIHGMANLGKSSLAARLANRLSNLSTVVVFDRYDALAVFDRVVEAIPPAARAAFVTTWRNAVMNDSHRLRDALEDALTDPLADRPILLIVDDLERILEPPQRTDPTTQVRTDYRPVIGGIIAAFEAARTASRLLVTSRYTFTLPDATGNDLGTRLVPIALRPMDPGERAKQVRAALRGADRDRPDDAALLARAVAAAAGNPGLQAVLMRPILADETNVATEAIAAIEHFRQTGAPPDAIRQLVEAGAAADADNAIVAFFIRMAFDTYRNALARDQAALLAVTGVFEPDTPIPREAIDAAGKAAGTREAGKALDRLLNLGLVDDWETIAGITHCAANPLARPLAPALDASTVAAVADAALPVLGRLWRDADGDIVHDPRGVAMARLALLARRPDPTLLERAAVAGGRHLFLKEQDARRALDDVLAPALDRLKATAHAPSLGLLMVTADCAERLGERDLEDRAIDLMASVTGSDYDIGSAELSAARRHARRGEPDDALRRYDQAAERFRTAGRDRDQAIARGGIADILQARGQLDEALRIRTQEQLPVYERLGDVRSKAVTQGQIADILQARGQLDEALRILRDDLLPVFERLGDVRSKAVTQGQIADILQARGQLDEALRIRIEEELPVYERLGDVRSKAVTQGQIADILQARGQLDEAIALHEARVPVAERMGDLDSLAHIKSSVANLKLERGNLDTEELQSIAADLIDAFRIGRQLGRPDYVGGIGQLLAQVLAASGLRAEALETLREAEATFETLDHAAGLAHVRKLRSEIESD